MPGRSCPWFLGGTLRPGSLSLHGLVPAADEHKKQGGARVRKRMQVAVTPTGMGRSAITTPKGTSPGPCLLELPQPGGDRHRQTQLNVSSIYKLGLFFCFYQFGYNFSSHVFLFFFLRVPILRLRPTDENDHATHNMGGHTRR